MAAVIEGPAGGGKARLLETARALARSAGLSVCWACPTELERDPGVASLSWRLD